jgi:hypothetical protein
MKILFRDSSSMDQFGDDFNSFETLESVKSILVMSCDANNWNLDFINDLLIKSTKVIFGGVFPQVLYHNKAYESGYILVGFNQATKTQVVLPLTGEAEHVEKAILKGFDEKSNAYKTRFVFVDGLSGHISSLIDDLFFTWGLDASYIGGGAGSLSFTQRPCIYTNMGLLENAAVLVALDIDSGVGVAHGWKPISDALKVTDAYNNIVKEINWRPAFEVYKETIELLSDHHITQEDFFHTAKGYPLGISRLAEEMIVRDPISTDGYSLTCVGEVPKNVYIHILKGTRESLLEGAQTALSLAKHNSSDRGNFQTLFIDCISRVMFLEKDFPMELEVVGGHGKLFGALTLGEIANTGHHYLEFYNKTAVVALLKDDI